MADLAPATEVPTLMARLFLENLPMYSLTRWRSWLMSYFCLVILCSMSYFSSSSAYKSVQNSVTFSRIFSTPRWSMLRGSLDQDHHPRGGALRHHRERQGQDPGQGGHPPGPAEAHLRRQAAGGRQDPL